MSLQLQPLPGTLRRSAVHEQDGPESASGLGCGSLGTCPTDRPSNATNLRNTQTVRDALNADKHPYVKLEDWLAIGLVTLSRADQDPSNLCQTAHVLPRRNGQADGSPATMWQCSGVGCSTSKQLQE